MDRLPSTTTDQVCGGSGLADPLTAVNVHICPTTGGQIDVRIAQGESVESLKRNIGKKLKIPRERISLLYRDRILKDGTVAENGICDGCKITLLPNVESGLMSQKPDNSVMQALENLTEVQVHDFLDGKAPLTLAMRLGEHMMLVQLQLSTSQLHHHRRAVASSPPSSSSSSSHPKASSSSRHSMSSSSSSAASASTASMLPSVMASPGSSYVPMASRISQPAPASMQTVTMPTVSPTAAVQQPSPSRSPAAAAAAPSVIPAPVPMATTVMANGQPNSKLSVLDSVTLEAASRNLHHRLREFSKYSNIPQSSSGSQGSPSVGQRSPGHILPASPAPSASSSSAASSPASSPSSAASSLASSPASSPVSSPRQPSPKSPFTSSSSNPGAIIETMHHHGHGVYSGTFSGTLNPTLQDRSGKPRYHIGTIVHILNDLLGAAPQYQNLGHHHHHHHHLAGRRVHHHHHHHYHHHHHQNNRLSPNHSKSISDQIRVSQENQAMRHKMDHLHSMMAERRQRRRQRRQARASPYATWSSEHAPSPSDASDNSMDVDTNVETTSVSDVSDNIYNEFTQETVVV